MKKFIFLFVFALSASLILSSSANAQITAVTGSPQSLSNNSSTITVVKPSGLIPGDIMLVQIMQSDDDNGSLGLPVAAAGGWTLITDQQLLSSGNNELRGSLFYRLATSADNAVTDYTFNLSAAADDNNSIGLLAFRGVNNATPFDATLGSFNIVSTDDLNAAAITNATANAMIVMFGMNADDEAYSNWQLTTGSLSLGTEPYDVVVNGDNIDYSIGAAYAVRAATTSTGAGTAELGGNDNESNGAILIALKPGPASVALTPAATQSILTGGSVNFTATFFNFAGAGNASFTWSAPGATIGTNPTSGNPSSSKSITFPTATTYNVSVNAVRAPSNATSGTTIVNAYTVNAGLDQVIVVPTVNLSGTASGGTGITSYAWTKVSGPAGESYSTPSAAATTVSNLSTGVYVFRLTVNGISNIFNDVQVTVTLPPNQSIGCNGAFFVSHGTDGITSTSTTFLEKLRFELGVINSDAFSTDPTNIGFNGIGLNPKDGYMYGIRYPAAGQTVKLVKIGAGTPGNIVDHGNLSGGGLAIDESVFAGCFDADGTYFIITENDQLLRIAGINFPVLSLTTIAVGNVSAADGYFVDIAIDPTDGQMYGVTLNQVLYKINKTNGNLTTVGTTAGSQIFALFFDEVGGLFGYRADGTFQKINKGTAGLTEVGTAPTYSYADGCSCSFGRVFHDLDFTQNPGNQICATQGNPNPSFPLTVSVTNQTAAMQTGLTYTLSIVDPLKRFRFTEDAATIRANVIAANLALNDAGTVVTLTTQAPATGTNYNKVVITGFRTGIPASTLSFILQVQLYTLGGSYNPIPLQSSITGLLPSYGGSDLSNDPTSDAPDDPTTISFCGTITLPVKLISFTGVYKNNTSELFWVAENQMNFAQYELERSSNGVDFSQLTVKAAQGGTSRQSYQYTDNLALTSGNVFYYRLKMVDIDGSFKYSNVIMIQKSTKGVDGINISPNPVVNTDVVTARVSSATSGTVNLSVIDMAGRVVLRQQSPVSEGVNSIAITNLDRLQPGVYMLKMINGEKVESTKFSIIR